MVPSGRFVLSLRWVSEEEPYYLPPGLTLRGGGAPLAACDPSDAQMYSRERAERGATGESTSPGTIATVSVAGRPVSQDAQVRSPQEPPAEDWWKIASHWGGRSRGRAPGARAGGDGRETGSELLVHVGGASATHSCGDVWARRGLEAVGYQCIIGNVVRICSPMLGRQNQFRTLRCHSIPNLTQDRHAFDHTTRV